MNKTVAIITARIKSNRLPGKVLLPLYGKPALQWVADRCLQARLVDDVIIATMADPSNNPIWKALGSKYSIYRYYGEEDDVLERVLSAAQWSKADVIVDISGDCPLVDGRHIDKLIGILRKQNLDYASNIATFPNGLDVQVCTTKALAKIKELFDPEHHVSWNIKQYPEIFDTFDWIARPGMHHRDWGLTLDEIDDYKLLKIIFDHFGKNPSFTAEEVAAYLTANPHLLDINRKVQRKNPEEEG